MFDYLSERVLHHLPDCDRPTVHNSQRAAMLHHLQDRLQRRWRWRPRRWTRRREVIRRRQPWQARWLVQRWQEVTWWPQEMEEKPNSGKNFEPVWQGRSDPQQGGTLGHRRKEEELWGRKEPRGQELRRWRWIWWGTWWQLRRSELPVSATAAVQECTQAEM